MLIDWLIDAHKQLNENFNHFFKINSVFFLALPETHFGVQFYWWQINLFLLPSATACLNSNHHHHLYTHNHHHHHHHHGATAITCLVPLSRCLNRIAAVTSPKTAPYLDNMTLSRTNVLMWITPKGQFRKKILKGNTDALLRKLQGPKWATNPLAVSGTQSRGAFNIKIARKSSGHSL